ncbi:MAG: LCP family protein [Dehalococcoidia bacterium]|nr:LCP family protein [Dehalococcoidia bacterium]
MSTGERTSPAARSRSPRLIVAAAIVLFLMIATYLALVIITHVDSIFFPGNEISIPGGSAIKPFVPGIDPVGNSGPQARINVLMVGIDRRPTEGNTLTRTDTIEVVSIDPKTKSATILGVPRDLWVEIPLKSGGTYQDRVNTALVAAETQNYSEGPIGLMKEVIQRNLNIKIDHYVMVDFSGFKQIIDGLGGIEVDVPERVYDPYYSESEKPGDYNPQDFKPGLQHMNGSTALAYSRIRYSSDDLDRIQRQQRVIFATIAKANSLGVLKNAVDLWNQYKNTIQTDISDGQIPGYALLAKQVENNIRAVSLGPATVPCNKGAAEVLCSSPEALARIVNAVFADKPSAGASASATPPAPVMVQVQNGTSINELAKRVTAFIASRGYPVDDLTTANAFDGASHSQSEILDISGNNQANAEMIANWLKIPISRVRPATATERAKITGGAEVVVLLGTDGNFGALTQSAASPSAGG